MGEHDIEIRSGDWASLGADAGAVRNEVFVREQGIPAEMEWDEADAGALHAVAYVDGAPVGTGRLLPAGSIGRMAVLARARRHGVGSRLLATLVGAAAQRGDAEVTLSAQAQVVPFYAAHGFVAEGAPYDEVGIVHQRMRLRLAGTGTGVGRAASAAPGAGTTPARGAEPARAAPAVRVTERTVTMPDGTVIFQREWTLEADAAAARGVYLLHGLGEHSGRYDGLARWFVARGWRVRAHDHVGHGRSGGRRGVLERHDQIAEQARALLDAFATELGTAPLLLGHSLGGGLAADLVVNRGAPVAGLVLSSPALDTGLSGAQRALLWVLERVAPSLAVGNGLDPAFLSHDAAVVQAYLDDPLVHDRVAGRLLRWLVDAGEQARRQAGTLSVPTLLLVAGSDRLVRPEGSRAFAQRAPRERLTLHFYDQLYHELFNELEADRQRVLGDLERWLSGRFGA